MTTRKILVVDDDARVRASLTSALANEHTSVIVAPSGEAALQIFATTEVDVALVDLRMPGIDGLALLELVRERRPDTDVILMTAYEDLPTVARVMAAGAFDFLVKPLDLHQLRRVLERAFEDRAARAQSRRTPKAVAASTLIGRHPAMIDVFKTVGRVAQSRTTVIIRGESGTGKELIARAIHEQSASAAEPFVAVNCTSIPPTLLESELFGHRRGAFTGATADRTGRFAAAGQGTIFLDEIGDTSLEFQTKLLRVLQEHEYYPVGADRPQRTNARVLTATHRPLEEMVAKGAFREDLYYRLRVVEITVPPLRERMDDVPLLADHLLEKASRAVGRSRCVLTSEAVAALSSYSWPGNVRELENCITRAIVLATGDVIRPEHLTLPSASGPNAGTTSRALDDVEREHVRQVLENTGWHKLRSAEILGVSRPRLDRLIAKHGFRAPDE